MADDILSLKICTKCQQSRILSEFSKQKASKDGLKPLCKSCIKITNATYYAKNSEKISAYLSKKYLENPERIKVRVAVYQKANPEKLKTSLAAWRRDNAAKEKISRDSYRKSNPEKMRIYVQNRRARKRIYGGKLTSGLPAKLFKLQKGKCACCAKPLGKKYHLDHIMPLALGGSNTDDNIQLLRAICNLQKNAKHPIDFMRSRGFLL